MSGNKELRSRLLVWALVPVLAAPLGLAAQTPGELPELRRSLVPILPARVPTGGEVVVELTLAPDGTIESADVLRTTPPYTEVVVESLAGWLFSPIEEDDDESAEPRKVLVAALVRPPSFYAGTTLGEPPTTVAAPSPGVAFPENMVLPSYPPVGYGDAVVLLSAVVGPDGRVVEAVPVTTGTGFESAALEAARQWRFRPARSGGAPAESRAILLFGFREPVVPSP